MWISYHFLGLRHGGRRTSVRAALSSLSSTNIWEQRPWSCRASFKWKPLPWSSAACFCNLPKASLCMMSFTGTKFTFKDVLGGCADRCVHNRRAPRRKGPVCVQVLSCGDCGHTLHILCLGECFWPCGQPQELRLLAPVPCKAGLRAMGVMWQRMVNPPWPTRVYVTASTSAEARRHLLGSHQPLISHTVGREGRSKPNRWTPKGHYGPGLPRRKLVAAGSTCACTCNSRAKAQAGPRPRGAERPGKGTAQLNRALPELGGPTSLVPRRTRLRRGAAPRGRRAAITPSHRPPSPLQAPTCAHLRGASGQ
eukprot:scaffold674_cov371-Prasinococcus_capsulatus_cf.AAC.21